MPTFKPKQFLVRTELRINEPAIYEVSWRNHSFQLSFESWDEAFDEAYKLLDYWEAEIRESFPEFYVRFNRTGPGSWIVSGFDPESLCPKQVSVDCEVYVYGVLDGQEKWILMTNSVFDWLEAEPEPEPEPEPIVIPIPSWDWVETEPEPDYAVARDFMHYDFLNNFAEPEPEQHQPEPDQDWEPTLITRGYLRVTVETHDKLVEGNKAFNLPYHRPDAVWQAGVYTSEIRNRITDLIGFQPESQAFEKSPYWDMPDQDRGNWCEWICTWRADFYQGLERVTFEWGFDHDQPPFEAEEKEDSTEPLWLGCITVEQPRGKRSTCQASNHRFVISEWIKGGVETYALMTDYCGLDSEHIVGKHSLTDISRDGQSERDVNVTLGDLVGEGIRLL